MIYLSGAIKADLLQLGHKKIGAMFQPRSYGMDTVDRWPMFAADNGGYGDRFDPAVWLPCLDEIARRGDRCLFAVVPDSFNPHDIPGNFARTQAMWERWHGEVVDRELRAAWVAQNGATPDDIPPRAGAVFIGGDNGWKTSERAWAIVSAAKARGCWVHIGRVNGLPRFWAGAVSGADSADGNLLKYGYDANLPALLRFLDLANRPHLTLFGGAA